MYNYVYFPTSPLYIDTYVTYVFHKIAVLWE